MKIQNILFIGYWGVNDPLSISTIYPHLRILNKFENIENIIYVSIERVPFNAMKIEENMNKVKHIPLISKQHQIHIFEKISNFIKFPYEIKKIIKQHNIDKIIARSSMAGSLALKSTNSSIPVFIESFEPHAQYMIDAKVWKKFSLRYIYQIKWERLQKKYAFHLMPVSLNYLKKLEMEGVCKNKISIIPCCVDILKYKYDRNTREDMRRKLNIKPNEIVGIYVGKFGGMYLEEESFELFKRCFEQMPDIFRLIILSPNLKENILYNCNKFNLNINKIFIKKVDYNEVELFLCASDFAFALYKPTQSAKFLSPIKIGEYWSIGLPIIITKSIGDDSEIVEKNNIGAVLQDLNVEEYNKAILKIKELLAYNNKEELKLKISNIGKKYRSVEIAERVYKSLYYIEK